MSDTVMTTSMVTVRVADCVNFTADIVGHDLDDGERQVLLAALDYGNYEGSGGYTGTFNLDGGYGAKLNNVIFAVARFLNQNQSATDEEKMRYRHIARVGMI